MITEDQFVELVSRALQRHISRDKSIVEEDQEWETANTARTIASDLRQYGLRVPEIT